MVRGQINIESSGLGVVTEMVLYVDRARVQAEALFVFKWIVEVRV